MNDFKMTGGAMIGWANATWPFATLTLDKDKLQLNVSVLGNLIFLPEDIISIVPHSGMMSSGIKINHKVSTYKNNVVFWTFGSSNELLGKIEQTGFLTNTRPPDSELRANVSQAQSQGGFPIKTVAAIVMVLVWNLLFFLDARNLFEENKLHSPLGLGAQLALGFVLMTCIGLLTSESVRRLILKPGRTVEDIKKFAYFIMAISGFILITTILTH